MQKAKETAAVPKKSWELILNDGSMDYTKMPGYTERVAAMLKKEIIYKEDYEHFTQIEKDCFTAYMCYCMANYKDVDLIKWQYQMSGFSQDLLADTLAENEENHIPFYLGKGLRKYSSLSSVNQLSRESGIPKDRIAAFFDKIPDTPGRPYMRKFKALESRVMAKVYSNAMDGDMTAAKLFLTVTGAIEQTPRTQTVHNTQNNFIQLNGNILSQNTIEQLPEAQQVKVWELINKSLPQKQIAKTKK